MAEARSAIAFSFTVGPEGVDINLNNEAVRAIWQSGVVSWKKRIGYIKNDFLNTLFPSGPISLLLILAFVLSIRLVLGIDPSHGIIGFIQDHLIGFSMFGKAAEFYVSCAIFSGLVWILKIVLRKYLLHYLLTYQGWIYEVRGPVSLKTKVWHVLVKLIGGRNPLLKGYQGSLPNLPVPTVKQTVHRYLESVKAFLTPEKYEHMTRIAAEFQNNLGNKLQRYLVLKSWWSANYVSDWWEDYVYLKGRSPIMVNSNFYGMDCLLSLSSEVQTARAANMVYAIMMFRRELERETLKPLMLNKTVPLCSAQYERLFNTTRIPGKEMDTLTHLTISNHIIVLHAGRYYKIMLRHGNRYYKPCELELMFKKIINDPSEPQPGELHLAALTAGPRVQWAEAREKYFSRGKNRASLKAIEKAAFFVALDDEPYNYNPNDHTELNKYACALLHGKCYDRWFDKSFNMCVGTNGRVGFNGEHSWADAPIVAHMAEASILFDAMDIGADAPVMAHLGEFTMCEDRDIGYREDGHTLGEPEIDDTEWDINGTSRLQWDLSDACQEVIEDSLKIATDLANDVDIHLMLFKEYGKGFMKKCKVSPDAYIQLALQLSYYRDAGKFCLTYESAMTRLFREGRTETVRSCTNESSAWVSSMMDPNVPKAERRVLFHKAVEKHVSLYREAMTGKGIDRHLFCLYVVSQYLGEDSQFLREVLAEPWRLSTSQTPQQQTDKLDLKEQPNHFSGGGGFGPVADDGYGVSYMISGEHVISFHISSKRSSDCTNSLRYSERLCKSFADLKELFT